MAMMTETYEKQKEDSDIIFTAISTGNFDNFKQAEQAVVTFYVTDMTFSRAGISHALKRLEAFYSKKNTEHYTPNYATVGRHLSEQDTLRVLVLAIKHMSREHHDWPELMRYVELFDVSSKA